MPVSPGQGLRLVALLCLACLSGSLGLAQGVAPQAGDLGKAPEQALDKEAADGDLVTSTLALDIATASFYELAAWASSLGLAQTGSIAELRQRLYAHYGVEAPGMESSGLRISIERAGSAEYFKLDYLSDSIVRISGGVILSLKDDKSTETHRLEADEVLYDRSRNSVTAKGHVHYRREKEGNVDEFTGQTLTANLDDWSGIFLDGVMRRSTATASAAATATAATASATTAGASSPVSVTRAFSFEADSMLRRSGNVILLENGVVSACDEEHPHYSVRAKRLWLLDSNEWAVSDAVLSIGEVPVLWLPFFFYPGEEIVFHPSLGYRDREGRFVQTTTYLIGAKPAKKDSSILSFAQTQDSRPKELKGLFLRSVEDSGKKAEDKGGASLKILADVYSSLGAYLGLVASLPKLGVLRNLKLDLGLGLSRSIFSTSSGYSPLVAAGNWASVWNTARLVSISLPFRYGLDLSASLQLGDFSASLALPLYSDMYYDGDFRDRSEDMDWIGLSSSSTTATATTTTTTRSSFTQKLDLSWSARPKSLSPWLSSIQVTRLSTSLAWLSKKNATLLAEEGASLFNVDPARYFFYPSLLRPIDLALTLKGSLIGQAGQAKEGEGTKAGSSAPAGSEGLQLRSPWAAEGEGQEARGEGTASRRTGSAGTEEAGRSEFLAPGRLPSFPASTAPQGGLSLDWTLSPSYFVEDRFLSDKWNGLGDVQLSDLLYSLQSWSVVSSLDAAYTLPGGGLAASLGLGFTTQDQGREASTDADFATLIASYRLTDYKYKLTKLSSGLHLQAKPFADVWALAPSTLSYNLEGTLYRYAYSALDGSSNPIYTVLTPGWDKDTITTSSAVLNLGLRTGSSTQTLGLTMSLPPLAESYSAALNLEAGSGDWGLVVAARTRAYRASSDLDFSWDPITTTFTGKAPLGIKLSDTLVWDSANSRPKTNTASLAWGGLSATLTAGRSLVYTPVAGAGWTATGSETFQVTDFTGAFKDSWKTPAGLPFSATLGLDTSYSQSLLRFSESTISFGLTLSFKVSSLLDLSFSSVSQNRSAWRYWPWLFPAVYTIGDPSSYFRNPLEDIGNSFAFGSSTLREASLFKLKSLSVKLSHDLHDWDLSFELTATPTLDSTAKAYYLLTTFSLLLKWRDMPEIKSSLSKDASGYSF